MKNIMVIDDDVYIGDMLEEMLRREGYGVRRAYSGTERCFFWNRKALICPSGLDAARIKR